MRSIIVFQTVGPGCVWSVQVVERIFLWGVFVAVCGVSIKRRHLLSLLLMLEVAALSLFVGRIVGAGAGGLYELSLIIIGIRACEASVGLGMLIGFARMKGSDLVELGLVMKV